MEPVLAPPQQLIVFIISSNQRQRKEMLLLGLAVALLLGILASQVAFSFEYS